MRTQNEISREFFKFPSQIIHFLGLPIFFFVFVLIYRPKTAIEFLDIRGLMEFNLIILSCILLLVMVGTRLAFFFLKKVMHLNYILYAGWCVCETIIFCLFGALYLHLMQGRVESFFSVVSQCISQFSLIVLWPYLIIASYCTIRGKNEELASPLGAEEGRIHFRDENKKVKLIVAANSILYIEARENYVEIVYTDADVVKRYTLRSSMKKLEPILHAQGLQRCHRAYYINPKHIKVLSKDPRGYMVADLDVSSLPSIPVSKTYYAALSALL